jgi:hypothetical protein
MIKYRIYVAVQIEARPAVVEMMLSPTPRGGSWHRQVFDPDDRSMGVTAICFVWNRENSRCRTRQSIRFEGGNTHALLASRWNTEEALLLAALLRLLFVTFQLSHGRVRS